MAHSHKEKGNEAFKAGDWASAVGHYTAAIFGDRKEPTFPLNRAAAYLKLGKNEDAERDCSTALDLGPRNVKALFRRGQARVALGKTKEAVDDFKVALQIEPANEAVKQELSKLGQEISSDASTSNPYRRRIPIKVVRSSAPSQSLAATTTSSSNLLTPVSSRILKETGSNPQKPPVTPKESPPVSVPRKIGGGIFRPSGDHTIFTHLEPTNTPPAPEQPITSPGVKDCILILAQPPAEQEKLPMTLFTFSKAWGALSTSSERWNLLAAISPRKLPVLFQASLDPHLLNLILSTFLTLLTDYKNHPNEKDLKNSISQYMNQFSQVPRFGTVTLFFSEKEKEVVRKIWEELGERPKWGV